MTTKFMSVILLAATVAFALASGTAFADEPAGYAYPNFWAGPPAQQQSAAGAAHQNNDAAISMYATHTHRSTGTYLFPPNPWQ